MIRDPLYARPTASSLFRSVRAFFLAAAFGFCGGMAALAATPAATQTTLAIASGGMPVNSVQSGNVVTLTATVSGLSGAPGLVNFCDAAAAHCTDIHLVGQAQVTPAGTAIFRVRPGTGDYRYKAVFAGTIDAEGSSSGVATLTVNSVPTVVRTTTSISQTGGWGTYTLTGTTTEVGSPVAPTGTITFADTTHQNATLATADLGGAVTRLAWPDSSPAQVGGGASPVATGDLNGDGIVDAVIANYKDNTVSVLYGNGDGSFTVGPVLKTDASPDGVAIGDFNSDGLLDLVASSQVAYQTSPQTQPSLNIYLNDGKGGFSSSTIVVPGTAPVVPGELHVADLNRDGIPDLVVGSQYNNTIWIYLGKGDGSFIAGTNLATARAAFSIAVADYNGDGYSDLAVAENGNGVEIFPGKGDGTFGPSTSVITGSYSLSIVTADLNGDGIADLVETSIEVSSIAVLIGNGDGTFKLTTIGSSVPTEPAHVAIGDFNRDGIPDIVYDLSEDSNVRVLLGKGDGTFSAALTGPPNGTNAQSLGVADFNSDGWPDLLLTDYFSKVAPVWLTEPTQTVSASAQITIPVAGQHLASADYSGDSNFASSTSETLALWGMPPATATALAITAGGSAVTSVNQGTTVTLTASVVSGGSPLTTGIVDFCDASAASCSGVLRIGSTQLSAAGTANFQFIPAQGGHSYRAVFEQGGAGLTSESAASPLTVNIPAGKTFPTITTITQGGNVGNYTLTASVIGIGNPTVSPTGTVSFLDTSASNLVLGTAGLGSATPGLFWQNASPPNGPTGGDSPAVVVSADFNGDGKRDLAVLNSRNGTIDILLGKGDGTYIPGPKNPSVPGTSNTSKSAFEVLMTADVNGDGIADLVSSVTNKDNTVSLVIFLGAGDGTFTRKVNAASLKLFPASLVSADFNGDGRPDIAVSGGPSYYPALGNAYETIVLLGQEDGTFTISSDNFTPTFFASLIAVEDLNNDHVPDIVVLDGENFAAVLLGKGDGTFQRAADFQAAQAANTQFGFTVADVNHDGKIDLVVVSNTDNNSAEVNVYPGNGDGTFQSTAISTTLNSAQLSEAVFADFDQDGNLDVAVPGAQTGTLVFLQGKGDGTFTEIPQVSQPSINNAPAASMTVGDFNGDGWPDVVALFSNSPFFPYGTPNPIETLLVYPAQTITATVTGIAPPGPGEQLVDASYPGDSKYNSSTSGTVSLTSSVAPPVLSVPGGNYTAVQTVTITDATPGAQIYYTLDGYFGLNPTPYTGPIAIKEAATTLEVYATAKDYVQSATVTATYTLTLTPPPAPAFSLAAGSYPAAQTVTISDATPGTVIYYTTDGSVPNYYTTIGSGPNGKQSAMYTGPVTVSATETLVAVAANGYALSAPARALYYIGSSAVPLIYSLAGSGQPGYSGDGGPATQARFQSVAGTAIDSAGNVYIADGGNGVIREVMKSTGDITTIAGTGLPGYSGDGGPALKATFDYPQRIALDGAGNLYVADQGNNVIRKIALSSGTITTVAGNGQFGFAGDNGPATSASLAYPQGVAVDGNGNLYISDTYNNRVRRVDGKSGAITTVAGGGSYGYPSSIGDGGPATQALLNGPDQVALNSKGDLYIADTNNNVVRKVDAATAIISTIAGVPGDNPPSAGYSGDGGLATAAQLSSPQGLAVNSAGDVFIADTQNSVIRKVSASTGIITTIAGNNSFCSQFGGDGGAAASASLCWPVDVQVNSLGELYVGDASSQRVRIMTAPIAPPTSAAAMPTLSVASGTYETSQIVTISDSTSGASIYITLDGSLPTTGSAGYYGPIAVTGAVKIQAIAVGPEYLTSGTTSARYVINQPPPATLQTVAGNGTLDYTGNGAGQPAVSASVGDARSTVIDSSGNLYIAGSCWVWKVDAKTGTLSIYAGTVQCGYSGDGGAATSAQLGYRQALAVDKAGNLFVADSTNNVVREVSATTGIISTVAGVYQTFQGPPYGDGGPATSASLSFPQGIAIDSSGNLYIADTEHHRVRKVTPPGIISTYAGDGSYKYSDGALATKTGIGYVSLLTVDGAGNLYIYGTDAARIVKVDAAAGTVYRVAGNGSYASSGDGGPATSAGMYPLGLVADGSGNLFVSELNTICEIDAKSGTINRIAGNGYFGFSGDDGAATMASLSDPQGLSLDASGRLYFADNGNARVRQITFYSSAPAPELSILAGTYATAQSVTITDSQQGAVIYYTLDGSTPTAASTKYTGPVLVSVSATLQAIAVASGFTDSAVTAATYTINLATPTIAVTPATTTITDQQTTTISVTLSGGMGLATPSGTVTLASGNYAAQHTLSTGSASFSIPGGALADGSATLTATYSGDSDYASATGSATVTVTSVYLQSPPASPAVTAGQSAPIALTLAAGSYSGTMNFSCSLTTAPANAQSNPTCSLSPATLQVQAGSSPTAVLTIQTTAASGGSAAFDRRMPWMGGGVTLAGMLLLGLSGRNRRTLARYAAGVCFATLAILSLGCGGGGSTSAPPPPSTPATTAGSYTFTIMGTDSANSKIAVQTKAQITVQ